MRRTEASQDLQRGTMRRTEGPQDLKGDKGRMRRKEASQDLRREGKPLRREPPLLPKSLKDRPRTLREGLFLSRFNPVSLLVLVKCASFRQVLRRVLAGFCQFLTFCSLFPFHCWTHPRPLSEQKPPGCQKWLKDTRMVNVLWKTDETDRFGYSRFYTFSQKLSFRTSRFLITFNTFEQKPKVWQGTLRLVARS